MSLQAVDKTLLLQGFVYSLGVWKLNPYAFFKELIFEQKICKNILSSIQRRLQFHIIGLFLSSCRLISPHFLFSLIFKFPCTMGENIRENRKCGEISLLGLRKGHMIWNCNHLKYCPGTINGAETMNNIHTLLF